MCLHTTTERLVCTAGANHFAYFYGRSKVHWDHSNEWKSGMKIKTAATNVTNSATNWNFLCSANRIIHFEFLVCILLVYIFGRRIWMTSKGQYFEVESLLLRRWTSEMISDAVHCLNCLLINYRRLIKFSFTRV